MERRPWYSLTEAPSKRTMLPALNSVFGAQSLYSQRVEGVAES